jgi:hypothetical protein
MSPLSTWALTVGFITVVLVAALVVNAWLDRIEERARRRRHTDPEPIFRQERAREVMRSWTLDHDFVPRLSDPEVCQRCGYLRTHHEVTS